MCFIRAHLIKKIREEIKCKHDILHHDGFYIFDEPIIDNNLNVERVIDSFVSQGYFSEPYINRTSYTNWHTLSGNSLKSIYFKVRNNEFYINRLLIKDLNPEYKIVRIGNEFTI